MTTPEKPPALWHGYLLADKGLPPPQCVFRTDQQARPDQSIVINASEYIDSDDVLHVKAELLAELCRKSRCLGVLNGAGMDTSANVGTYANKSAGSTAHISHAPRLTHEFVVNMRPTPAHRVFAAMAREGGVKIGGVLAQCHSGLFQKAGLPHDVVNELHGSWLDSKENPVVPMSGNLRSDLFERMLQLEKDEDFCISIGSSHSGLNADRIARTPGERHKKRGKGLGMAMVTIQETPLDEYCALRVWGRCDEFMMLVAAKLGLHIDFDTDYDYATLAPKKFPPAKRTDSCLKYFAPNPYYVVGGESNAAAPSRAAAGAAVGAAAVSADAAPISKATAAAAAASSSAATNDAATRRMSISVGNRHELVSSDDGGEKKNSHRWTMFVQSTAPGRIARVTFHLHPTFTPSQIVVDAASAVVNNKTGVEEFTSGARLGWGTFDVGVEVTLKGSNEVLKTQHTLRFDTNECSAVHFEK